MSLPRKALSPCSPHYSVYFELQQPMAAALALTKHMLEGKQHQRQVVLFGKDSMCVICGMQVASQQHTYMVWPAANTALPVGHLSPAHGHVQLPTAQPTDTCSSPQPDTSLCWDAAEHGSPSPRNLPQQYLAARHLSLLELQQTERVL